MNERGMKAYFIRVQTQKPWVDIAKELEYASHNGCRHAAKDYSEKNNLPWPITYMTKGAAIYKANRIGVSWMRISKIYRQPMRTVKQIAYKYASRHNKIWPPNKEKTHG
jgi:hypothetical protein|tara:strand:+ start:121 stop:447 length:327 start_codon:yes stop_codon:yes gene_type:complete